MEKSDNLEEYFAGLDELLYLLDYGVLHTQTKRAILSWTEARMFYLYQERLQKFRDAYRNFSHFIITSNAVIEYLSVRLLTRHFSPTRDEFKFRGMIEDLSQHQRQTLMRETDIISGKWIDRLNRIRGQRNDFAHDMNIQLNLAEQENPACQVSRSWNTVSYLCSQLYGHQLDDIVDYLHRCFIAPHGDFEQYTTAQLVDTYQFRKNEGDSVEDLEEIFERRGFNPEHSPDFGTIERVEYWNHLWVSGGLDNNEDDQGMGLIELIDYSIPDGAVVNEATEYGLTFKLNHHPKIMTIGREEQKPALKDVMYYAILFVDKEVVDIQPSNKSGAANPRHATIGGEEAVSFEHKFLNDGIMKIDIGIHFQSEKDEFEWITNPATSDTTKVVGPL